MPIESQGHSGVEMGSSRSFGLVFSTVFTIIGLFPLLSGEPVRLWSLLVAVIFLVIALAVPKILNPLNLLWFKFGLLLAKFINPVVMFIIYVSTFIPIGLLLRLFRKDLLSLKLSSSKKSYWIVREPPGPEPDSFENQF